MDSVSARGLFLKKFSVDSNQLFGLPSEWILLGGALSAC